MADAASGLSLPILPGTTCPAATASASWQGGDRSPGEGVPSQEAGAPCAGPLFLLDGPDAGLMPGRVGASWNGKDKTIPQGRRGRKTGRGPRHFRALALRASQGDVRLAVSHPSLKQEELRLWDSDPHSQ